MAQAIGSALYEQMLIGPDGTVLTQALRNYHIPQLADVPVTEVLLRRHLRRDSGRWARSR